VSLCPHGITKQLSSGVPVSTWHHKTAELWCPCPHGIPKQLSCGVPVSTWHHKTAELWCPCVPMASQNNSSLICPFYHKAAELWYPYGIADFYYTACSSAFLHLIFSKHFLNSRYLLLHSHVMFQYVALLLV
jgi:hypothetical protein